MENDKVTISTPTEDILAFAETLMFNPDYKSSDEVLNATMVAVYGTILVLGVAGYDKEQLHEVLTQSIDNSYDMVQNVRDNLHSAMKEKMN